MSEEAAPEATPAPAPTPAAPAKGGRLSAADVAAHLDALEKGTDAVPPAEPAEESPGNADDGEVDSEETDEEPAADADDQPSDPDLDKRLSAIQKQEKRSREQAELTRYELLRDLDKKKADFEAEWRPRIEEAAKLHQIFERAKSDPSALADELGWDADTQLQVAQALWAYGHDKKGDPKFKQAADNMRRDSETRRKASTLEQKLAKLESELEAERAERHVEAVAAKAASSLSEKHPVLKSLKQDYVQNRIRMATQYLRQQTGKNPDPADVVAKLEQIERQDLIERVGPEKFAALGYGAKSADATTKPKTKPADKKETAPPMRTPPKQYSPPNRRRSADEILAEMDALERTKGAPS